VQCAPKARLPALYLIDCIMKTMKKPYVDLFIPVIQQVTK
jgi:hypothetical protein